MSPKEVEELLLIAVERLKLLETSHLEKVKTLEERIDYLEEMLSSQKNMLADSMHYINELKSNVKNEKV